MTNTSWENWALAPVSTKRLLPLLSHSNSNPRQIGPLRLTSRSVKHRGSLPSLWTLLS